MLFSGMLGMYPYKKLHLELQPNTNSLQAALCSGFAHHPLPRRIDSSFWYWDLEMIGASEWEPPCYPFQARWHLSLGLYLQRLQLIYKTQVDSNHHWCTAQVQLVQIFYQIGYQYAFELDNESRQVCVIVTSLAPINIIDCPWELITSLTLPKKSWRLFYMTFLIVRFTWIILEISAIAGKLLFRFWSKSSKSYKLTASFFILSNVNGQSKRLIGFGYWLTPIGFKPRHKFDAILHLQPPTSYTQLCSYRGSHLSQRHVSPLVAYSCTFNCHDQF